jgi:hypothetical protein
MAVITRSAHPDALWPGVFEWFGLSYKEQPESYKELFDTNKSSKHMEVIAESTQFGLAPEKAEGAAITYDEAREGVKASFIHKSYALGYIVTREEMEDNQYDALARARARALAFSMRKTKEIVHWNVLNRSFSVSYLGPDGVSLCSTAHVTRSGNQRNRPTTDADLSEASLEDAVKDITNMVNARGLRIQASPRRLVIPVNEMFNAQRIINSTLRSGTGNNDINAINSMGLFKGDPLVSPYLTDDDAWFITVDIGGDRGLKSFDRRPMDFGKDEDFGTENARAKSTMRFSVGWSDWRAIYGTMGAG